MVAIGWTTGLTRGECSCLPLSPGLRAIWPGLPLLRQWGNLPKTEMCPRVIHVISVISPEILFDKSGFLEFCMPRYAMKSMSAIKTGLRQTRSVTRMACWHGVAWASGDVEERS